jgi:predicted nucleic acid-binding protein
MILVDTSVCIDYFSGNGAPETDFLDGVLRVVFPTNRGHLS